MKILKSKVKWFSISIIGLQLLNSQIFVFTNESTQIKSKMVFQIIIFWIIEFCFYN
jgi:hypothetical protein